MSARAVLEDALREHFQTSGWPGAAVIACSGGMDSTVLARVGAPLLAARGVRVVLAHLDHGLRGRGAVADAEAVSALARELGVPLFRRTQRPDAEVTRRVGLQASARQVRRCFLGQTARRVGASVCLLAHHEDDQVETLLIQEARGRDARARYGIAAQSGLFARPWLAIPRSILEAAARAAAWPWREDPSNRDPRFLRGRVRAAAPLAPSMRSGLLAQALNARVRRTYVHAVAKGHRESVVTRTTDGRHVLNRERLCALEDEVALALLQRLTPAPERRPPSRAALGGLLRGARRRAGGGERRLSLGGGWTARWTGSRVDLLHGVDEAGPHGPGIGELRVSAGVARELLRSGSASGCWLAVFDGEVTRRSPRVAPSGAGRRIALFGGGGSRLVRDVLADAGVAVAARERWPLVEGQDREVLWVPGGRRSAHHPLTPASVDALVLYTVAPQIADAGNREWSL